MDRECALINDRQCGQIVGFEQLVVSSKVDAVKPCVRQRIKELGGIRPEKISLLGLGIFMQFFGLPNSSSRRN